MARSCETAVSRQTRVCAAAEQFEEVVSGSSRTRGPPEGEHYVVRLRIGVAVPVVDAMTNPMAIQSCRKFIASIITLSTRRSSRKTAAARVTESRDIISLH